MMRVARTMARERAVAAHDDAAYRLIGLSIIALVPALFWTGIVAIVGAAMGQAPSAIALVTFAAAVATFLFTAVSTLFARSG
jgi:hypothetical protein